MKERFRLKGIDITWDDEQGTQDWDGGAAVSMWIDSTMAGLLSGMQRMVGTERFKLSLHGGGRDSCRDDWAVISKHPTFEEGFSEVVRNIGIAGWGRWELVSLDREAREACVRIYNNWETSAQKAIGASWGSAFVGGKLSGIFERFFEVPACWAEQTRFVTRGDAFDEFLVKPAPVDVDDRIERLLTTDHATKADLAVALEKLRHEVDERTRTEQELRDKLDLIARQEDAIRALSTPIIEVWDSVLALPLMGMVDSRRAADMMDRLLSALATKGARFAIIDMTGVDAIDTPTANHILQLAQAADLLGARCVITGIGPAVAHTMVSLGIDLSRVTTLATLRAGLERCMQWADEHPRRRSNALR